MQRFTDIFIRRPVFATVLSLILILVGLRAYIDLPVRQFPNIEPSVINITTSYPGASAQLMESFVSTPIEGALAGVQGIDFMVSSNTQGNSSVTVNFTLGYNIDKAIADISNAVASVRVQLPQGVRDPIIAKYDPNANPTLYLAFSSDKIPPEAIADYLGRVVKPQISMLRGVGQVHVYASTYAMRVWLDPKRMAAHNITADDIQEALRKNNVQSAAGILESKYQEINIIAETDFKTAEEFNNLVLKNEAGYMVRLKDVGHAALGPASERNSAIVNGKKTVIVAIIPQATANPLNVAKEVNAVMPSIQKHLPSNMKAYILWDASKFIAQSIKEVYHTIIESALCVIVVIFLFLGSWRAVFIPVVTIPVSLIGVCGIMLALGYSINTLTLLAAVLAIGLVVDDAIVVLENIHRHIEDGMSPMKASLLGAREIGFAVIAMTLTLAAVYAPIGFLTGITGSLFREFAFCLAAAVIISGFVALTLSPMMCSKLLHHDATRQGLAYKIDVIFNKLMARYKLFLAKALERKKLWVIIAAVIYASCYFLYAMLPSELAPAEDKGYFFVGVVGPTSANLEYTEKYTKLLEPIFAKIPEVETYGIINGMPNANGAFSFLVLKPWEKRHRSVDQIVPTLIPQTMSIPGIIAFPFNPPSLPTSERTPISFVLKTTGSYDDLNTAIKTLTAEAGKIPGIINPDTDLKLNKLQLTIDIDRNKASIMGISADALAGTLNMLLGQPTVTRFVMNGRSYDVIPQLQADFRSNPHDLDKVNLRTGTGELVPLSNIVLLKESMAPQNLTHFQQERSAMFTANLAPGFTLGQVLGKLQEVAEEKLANKNIEFDYSGESRQLMQASGAMMQTFLFALLFIFLVLAAQFESFRNPLIVMLSVPLSISGALLTMHIAGCTMNIYTQIGLVTLIGLITKHGILIVEFADKIQAQGKNIAEAVLESASLRLRPILMTTAAMILGAVPLALASGAGAEARRQIGWVIIGGMGIGTMLTLFVVPVAYTLLANIRRAPTGDEMEEQLV